jgi:hypothetical protein
LNLSLRHLPTRDDRGAALYTKRDIPVDTLHKYNDIGHCDVPEMRLSCTFLNGF